MNSDKESATIISNNDHYSRAVNEETDSNGITIDNQQDSYEEEVTVLVVERVNTNKDIIKDSDNANDKMVKERYEDKGDKKHQDKVITNSNNSMIKSKQEDKDMPNFLLKSSSNALILKQKLKSQKQQKPNKTLKVNPSSLSQSVSLIRKSKDTKAAEEIIVQLYQTGHLPNQLGYNYLMNKASTSKPISNPKNTSSSMDLKERKKTIQNFLNRNDIYLSQKQFNLERNTDRKGTATNSNLTSKAKFATLEISYRSPESTNPFKGRVRSPEQFKSDQDKFAEEKKRRLEEKRREVQQLKEKERQSKPIISENSKRIAQRAHSSNQKRETIHIKLYEEMNTRALSKEKLLKERIALQEATNHQNQFKPRSKEEIQLAVEKLHREGVEERKKREQLSIPFHMEEVNLFYSRDYSSYQSNIRTNTSKRINLTDSIDDFYDVTRAIREENNERNNNLIFMKKLLDEIDKGLKAVTFESQLSQANRTDDPKEEEEKNPSQLSFKHYSEIMFYIGMLQYDHSHFIDFILSSHPNQADKRGIVLDFDTIQWESVKLNKVVIQHDSSSGKVTKAKMIDEYKKLKESWSLLAEKGEGINVHLGKVKLFLLSVIGIYSGESNMKESHAKSLTLSIKKKSKSIQDYIDSMIIKNHPEISFNKTTAERIYSSFELFRRNRKQFEEYLRKEKTKQKMFNYSSNPEMTFKPTLLSNNNSSTIKTSESQAKIGATYELMKKKQLKKREKLQKEKELNELKECTFLPNQHQFKTAKTKEVATRLYSYSKPKKDSNSTMTNNNQSKAHLAKEEECTFSPKLNPPISNRLFSGKSVKDNPYVFSKVDQYSKARTEKKMTELLSKKGGASKLRTPEELIELEREENVKQFAFGIEKKNNRFTFECFSNKNNEKGYNARSNLPLFTIEVKIKNRIELLDYYKDNVPAVITKRFCKKHHLGESSREKILSVMEEKLKSMEII